MSLINDMLRDLEVRKASARSGDVYDVLYQHEQIEGYRSPGVAPRLDRSAQRRIYWLLLPFLLAIGGALLLYTTKTSIRHPVALPETPLLDATPTEEGQVESEPQISPTGLAENATSTSARPATRLVMLAASGDARSMKLDMVFNRALEAPIQLRRQGNQVRLSMFAAFEGQVPAAPDKFLANWHASLDEGALVLSFDWPADGQVMLQPLEPSTKGYEAWQLTLQAPKAAKPKPTDAVAAVAQPADKIDKAPAVPASRSASTSRPSEPSRTPVRTPALTPQHKAESLYAEAWSLRERGDSKGAINKLRETLSQYPQHVRARELLVRLLLQSGQAHQAELELVRALELMPGQPELLELYVRLLADQGRTGEALDLLSAHMQPNRISHQSLFAVLSARLGRHAEAAQAYQNAAALAPKDPRWQLGLGIALENLGQTTAALAAYRAARDMGGLDAISQGFVQGRIEQLEQGG